MPVCVSTHGRARACGPCVESTGCVVSSSGRSWVALNSTCLIYLQVNFHAWNMGKWKQGKDSAMQRKPVWTTRAFASPEPLVAWPAVCTLPVYESRRLWCNRIAFLAGAALFDVGEANTCGVRGPGKCQIPHAVYAGNYAPRIQMRSVIASWDNFNDNSTFSQGQIITHTWKNPDWSSLH